MRAKIKDIETGMKSQSKGLRVNKPQTKKEKNMGLKIIGNGIPREILYGYNLSKKEKEDFDWLDDIDCSPFFRYRGTVYSLNEIMAVNNPVHNPNPPDWQKGFDGYMGDSYFSGVLVKFGSNDLPDDTDYIRVYRFYS